MKTCCAVLRSFTSTLHRRKHMRDRHCSTVSYVFSPDSVDELAPKKRVSMADRFP